MSNHLKNEKANYESSKVILLLIDQQNHQFNSLQEEIQFYKNTRENALRDVIYSKMILDFQSLFPIGTSKAKEKYVISWQNSLNFFFQ